MAKKREPTRNDTKLIERTQCDNGQPKAEKLAAIKWPLTPKWFREQPQKSIPAFLQGYGSQLKI